MAGKGIYLCIGKPPDLRHVFPPTGIIPMCVTNPGLRASPAHAHSLTALYACYVYACRRIWWADRPERSPSRSPRLWRASLHCHFLRSLPEPPTRFAANWALTVHVPRELRLLAAAPESLHSRDADQGHRRRPRLGGEDTQSGKGRECKRKKGDEHQVNHWHVPIPTALSSKRGGSLFLPSSSRHPIRSRRYQLVAATRVAEYKAMHGRPQIWPAQIPSSPSRRSQPGIHRIPRLKHSLISPLSTSP